MSGRARSWVSVILAPAALWLLVAAASLKWGSVSDADWQLVLEARVPRVVLAAAIGIGLSISGAVLQALFTNPLCDPYTLGISSLAALGAVIGASLGFGAGVAGSMLLPTAFIGALGGMLVLLALSWRMRSSVTLLLAGVMMGLFGSSLVTLWMALTDATGVQGALYWLLGDLSRADLQGSLIVLVIVMLLSGVLALRSRALDGLLLGEEDARAVGVDVTRERRRILVLSSLLIGVCVSSAGMIGFVGLIVPHLARRWSGALHAKLLPVCGLLGAAVLTGADLLARTIHPPYELPAGVITALAGAPLYLWLMSGRGGAE